MYIKKVTMSTKQICLKDYKYVIVIPLIQHTDLRSVTGCSCVQQYHMIR